jgi:hypothetical protein
MLGRIITSPRTFDLAEILTKQNAHAEAGTLLVRMVEIRLSWRRWRPCSHCPARLVAGCL